METFAEWKTRTRYSGLLKTGLSIGLTVIAQLLFFWQDPANPDLGLAAIGTLVAIVAFFLWFLGIHDYSRSKGYHLLFTLLGCLWLVGFVVLLVLPEVWEAYGPDRKIKPSFEENHRHRGNPEVRRLRW